MRQVYYRALRRCAFKDRLDDSGMLAADCAKACDKALADMTADARQAAKSFAAIVEESEESGTSCVSAWAPSSIIVDLKISEALFGAHRKMLIDLIRAIHGQGGVETFAEQFEKVTGRKL